MKFKNAGEPSPATFVNYKAEQAEDKPFGQKGKEVQRLGSMGVTTNTAFSREFGKTSKQIHPLIYSSLVLYRSLPRCGHECLFM